MGSDGPGLGILNKCSLKNEKGFARSKMKFQQRWFHLSVFLSRVAIHNEIHFHLESVFQNRFQRCTSDQVCLANNIVWLALVYDQVHVLSLNHFGKKLPAGDLFM